MTAVAVQAFTWTELAHDLWPDAEVRGDGPFATIRDCGGHKTVRLHPAVEQARTALHSTMHPGGSRTCPEQRHVLIALDGWK